MRSLCQKQSAAAVTASAYAHSKIKSSTSSRIRSGHRVVDYGRRAIPKLSRLIRRFWHWQTTATRCSSTRASIFHWLDANTRVKLCRNRGFFEPTGTRSWRPAGASSFAGNEMHWTTQCGSDLPRLTLTLHKEAHAPRPDFLPAPEVWDKF